MSDIQRYNLASENKWVLIFPYNKLDSSYKNDGVYFNLKTAKTPSISLATSDVAYMGTAMHVATPAKNENKELEFEYMMSNDWHQFQILYKWFSMIAGEDGVQHVDFPAEYQLDLTLQILTEFKKPVMNITYYGCTPVHLGQVQLQYANANEIVGSFSIKYSFYKIEFLLPVRSVV